MRIVQRSLGLVLVSLGAGALVVGAGCSSGTTGNNFPDASYYNPPDAPTLSPPDAMAGGGVDAAPGIDAAGNLPDAAPGLDAGGLPDGASTADASTGSCSPACTSPEVCQPSGKCAAPLSALDLSKQPLLISELQADPASPITDSVGEYVEIINVSRNHILLDGLEIHDASGHVATVPTGIILANGATAVFVASTDKTMNGNITADGPLQPVTLNNSGGDTISIVFMGTTIHSVVYPGTGNDLNNTGLSATTGDSTQLDQNYINQVESGGSGVSPTWCLTPTTDTYATANAGTPSATNVACN